MKKNRKKILMLMILLIILLIIFCIMFVLLKEQAKRKTDEEVKKEEIESYTSDKTIPRGMSTLYSNYKGDRSLNDLYRKLDILVNYLPRLSNEIFELNNDELIKFYNKNSSEITEKIGIEQQEDFIKLANYLNTVDLRNKKFNSCELDVNSYNNTQQYFICNILFFYNEVENPITLKTYFSNDKNSTKITIFKTPN